VKLEMLRLAYRQLVGLQDGVARGW